MYANTAQLYENYNTGDDAARTIIGSTWRAQTFTVGSTVHYVTSVKLKLYKESGATGTLTVGIRNTDGSGHPTGSDLTSGTYSIGALGTGTGGAWVEIKMTPYSLAANTKYAIVVRSSSTSKNVYWRVDSSSPTYDDGNEEDSTDDGSSWTSDTTRDFMFEVWVVNELLAGDVLTIGFSITAPSSPGTYDVTVTAYDGTNWSGDSGSNTKNNAITVTAPVIKVYKDSAYTIEETVFIQGAVVYAKATNLASNAYYKIQWLFGATSKSESSEATGVTSLTHSYSLAPDAEIGTWYAKILQADTSGGPWTVTGTDTFYVWHALAPTADSWVESDKPTTNYGSDDTLHVKVDVDGTIKLRRTYLKFDLSGLPPGAIIDSAILHLYRTRDYDIPSAYKISNDTWTEMGINWNNALLYYAPGDFVADGTLGSAWIEWDITSYAASEFAGDQILSVVLKFKTESGSDQHADFTSRDERGWGTWDQLPWLEISYSMPPPQYYLTVTSPYGTTGGEGWYANCTTVYATLDTGIVDHGNGTRRVFTHWSGDASGTGLTSDPIHMDQNRTAIANWKTQYYLTVVSLYDTPGGEGWYNESDTAYATLVTGTVPIEPGAQAVFTGWGGDASGTGLTSDPITMDAPKTATANWKIQYYLTVNNGGHGIASGQNWYDAGSNATFGISPTTVPGGAGTQYVFTGWLGSGTGSYTGPDSSHSVTMNNPINETAQWKTQYNITVTASPSEALGGTFKVTYTKCGTTYTDVSQSTTWTEWADTNTNVTVSEPQDPISGPPSTQYVFDHYDPDDSVTMDTAKTITLFYKTQYRLTMATNFGTTSPSAGQHWYDAGTNVTISATAPSVVTGEQYVWLGWTGQGVGSYTDTLNPYWVIMNNPINQTASWRHQYLLTVLTDPSGLSPQPTRNPAGEAGPANSWWYNASTNVTLTAQSVTGYTFNNWDVAGTSRGDGVNPIDVHMDAPHNATAHYRILPATADVTFAQVGVGTDFTGTVLTVDGSNYKVTDLPKTFTWDIDSNHTFAYYSPLAVNGGKRYVWTSTSGLSTAQSGTITVPSGGGPVTGHYKTQFKITFSQSGASKDFTNTVLTINGNKYKVTQLPVSIWCDKDSTLSFTFNSPLIVNAGKRYVWTKTTGLSNLRSGTLTITNSGNVIGYYQARKR